jgi:hypothetical protein
MGETSGEERRLQRRRKRGRMRTGCGECNGGKDVTFSGGTLRSVGEAFPSGPGGQVLAPAKLWEQRKTGGQLLDQRLYRRLLAQKWFLRVCTTPVALLCATACLCRASGLRLPDLSVAEGTRTGGRKQ